MRTSENNKKGFTIVELLVAILIFSIWWLSAYLLVYAAINSSIKSRNEIIAWNLSREKIELIKNIRDTNWIRNLDWNKLDNWIVSHETSVWDRLIWWYYLVESDFDRPLTPTTISKLSSSFTDSKEYILNPVNPADKTNLCLDNKWRYTYTCIWNVSSKFYSFIKVEPLITKNASNAPITVNNALKLTSVIYNSEKWFTKWSISTIITDWKR
jgi:prepilin-type N-terminal cleavage/methylation domain-containing protein